MRSERDPRPAAGGNPSAEGGAEEKLRQSEERFRNVFDHAPIGILLLGSDIRIQRANRALCATLGYEEAEMLGRPVTDFLHADERAASDRLRTSVLAGAVDDISAERRAIRKDGHVVRLQVRSTVQRDAEGKVDIVISHLVDVTEQRAQEEKLRESEARLRTIFETAPIGMALIAPGGELLQVNHALGRMLGRTPEELQRMAVPDLAHPEDVTATRAQVERALAGLINTISGESRYLRPDGTTVEGAYHGSIVHDADGVPCYFVSQIVDVTERKRAEDQLRDSEARYRGLVELSQVLIVRTDLEGNLTFVNATWCAKFGLRREEVIGKSMMPRIDPADHPVAEQELRALTQAPYRTRVEIRQPTVDGVRWLEWEGCGIFAAGINRSASRRPSSRG